MKTITETVKLYLHQDMHSDKHTIFQTDMSEYGYILVSYKDVEITMDIPEGYDKNTAHIDSLKAEKQKIAGDAQLKMNNLEEQIQSLLAIEDKSNDHVA